MPIISTFAGFSSCHSRPWNIRSRNWKCSINSSAGSLVSKVSGSGSRGSPRVEAVTRKTTWSGKKLTRLPEVETKVKPAPLAPALSLFSPSKAGLVAEASRLTEVRDGSSRTVSTPSGTTEWNQSSLCGELSAATSISESCDAPSGKTSGNTKRRVVATRTRLQLAIPESSEEQVIHQTVGDHCGFTSQYLLLLPNQSFGINNLG